MGYDFDSPAPENYRDIPFDGEVMSEELSSALDLLPADLKGALVSFFELVDVPVDENCETFRSRKELVTLLVSEGYSPEECDTDLCKVVLDYIKTLKEDNHV